MKRRALLTGAALALGMGLAGAAFAQDKVKAGFVYVGPVGDGGWTYEHDQGRLAVEAHFGDKVETVYQESVPEGADAERAITQMALQGAEVLFYPSAIGSDCFTHWQTVMRGHAGANLMPLVCSNRVGHEKGDLGETDFWGRSFIADPRTEIVAQADDHSDMFISATFDLEEIRALRDEWAVFRDRRPELYAPLLTSDGTTPLPPR